MTQIGSAWGKGRIERAVLSGSGDEREIMDEMMRSMIGPSSRWERMEAWLFDQDRDDRPVEDLRFTNIDLAKAMRVDRREASALIASYLDAQRAPKSNTLYVLHRTGRTSTAVWQVGQRTADAREIAGTLFDDVEVKVKQAFAPDLKRLAEKNPRAAKFVSGKIASVVSGALVVLAEATDSFLSEDED